MAIPFLRWAGSKRQHVPFLRQCWVDGDYSRYIEPFAGSAAAFFAIAPPRALLGDINHELIHTYRAVRAAPQAVHRRLTRFPPGEDAYYKVRVMRPKGTILKAARFVYLNRFCFNGLYRTNRSGDFNVPYGAPRTRNVPDLEQFRACAGLLRRARLMHVDFRRLLAGVKEGDFVYLDPPYAVSRRRVFIQYAKGHFSTKDLADLSEWLNEIDRRKASFLLSYADSREARLMFRGWNSRRFAVRRNVAGFSSARRNHYELFISNIGNL
ncbi:MAG: DNA adenine methylase [Thermoanaerobaculia bacterium]